MQPRQAALKRAPAARARATAASLAVAVALVPVPCRAGPELSAGVTGGALFEARPSHTTGHLGLRGDLLFLRERTTSGGLGPYLEALTVGFDSLVLGGGVSALVPGLESFSVVPSFGAYGRTGAGGGVAAGLFVGFRGHNFHGVYTLANGLTVEGRKAFGEGPDAVFVGVRVDLAILAMPVLLLRGALK